VGEQGDPCQVLELEQLDDVVHMGGEVDGGRSQMVSLAHAGQSRRPEGMAILLQQAAKLLPGPSAGPGSVNSNDLRQLRLL
jgi:hypothetical protein